MTVTLMPAKQKIFFIGLITVVIRAVEVNRNLDQSILKGYVPTQYISVETLKDRPKHLHIKPSSGYQVESMSTRAIKYLKQHRVPHQVVTYDHREKGAEFAAQALEFPLAQTIKTLVVALDNQAYVLALMPGDTKLSLKKIAGACNAKRAAMADNRSAERLTGYLIGGISPFGTQKKLPVLMEKRLLDYDEIVINGGRRGIMLKMSPQDVVTSLNAKPLELM